MKLLSSLILISSLFIHVYGLQCKINAQLLPSDNPFYLTDDKKIAIIPDDTGHIILNAGDSLYLSCIGQNNHLMYGTTNGPPAANLKCIRDTRFLPENAAMNVNFMTTVCVNDIPATGIKDATANCNWDQHASAGSDVVNFVMKAVNVQEDFPLFTVCFDPQSLRTSSVRSVLYPANALFKANVNSPSFKVGDWFGHVKVDDHYTIVKQKQTFSNILNRNNFLTNEIYLDKGHLVPKADFIYGQMQRSTFTYLNSAPQWNYFNRNNWRFLERDLRNYIQRNNIKASITTGTIGILKLPDMNNNLQEICLVWHNSVCHIPVPLLFYKRFENLNNGQVTTFYGLNNPHATFAEGDAIQKSICNINKCKTDVNFSWLKWNYNNMTKGYVFCC